MLIVKPTCKRSALFRQLPLTIFMNISCFETTEFLSFAFIRNVHTKKKYILVSMYDQLVLLLVISSYLTTTMMKAVLLLERSGNEHPIHHHADDTCCNDQCIAQIQPLHLQALKRLSRQIIFSSATFAVPLIEWLLQLHNKRYSKPSISLPREASSAPVTSHNQLRAPPVLSAILKTDFLIS